MRATFEQARALYGSDEQMARSLFEQLAITRLDLELQSALRRRTEEKLLAKQQVVRRANRGND
jgi:hypothetical protein